MGVVGSKERHLEAAWLVPVLLTACTTATHRAESPQLLTETSLSGVLQSSSPAALSLQGRLVYRNTRSPVHSHRPIYIVAMPTAGSSPSSSAESLLIRDGSGFSPSLCVVPCGGRVRFDNRDKIFHNFFSTTVGNEFDLAPLDPGNSAFVRLDRPGTVQVYCSLHGGQRATILVLPSPAYARVDEKGRFDIQGLGPGRHVLQVWGKGIPRQDMEVYLTRNQALPIDFPIDLVPAKAGR